MMSNGHNHSAGLRWNADLTWSVTCIVMRGGSSLFLVTPKCRMSEKNIQYCLLSLVIPVTINHSVSSRIHSRPHKKTSAVWKYPAMIPFWTQPPSFLSLMMHHGFKSRFCSLCHSRRVAALASPKADAGSTGARAGAVFAPGAPGAILLDLIWVFPHAVTFVAPLERDSG